MTIKARWMVFAVAMIVLLDLPGPALADITGTVPRVQDGDTFDLCGADGCQRIRLCGINAPERDEAGADAATAALHGLVAGQPVRCVQVGYGTVCDGRSKPTNQGRMVAQCFVGGTDIAGALVSAGHACDWRKFSGGAYGGRECGR